MFIHTEEQCMNVTMGPPSAEFLGKLTVDDALLGYIDDPVNLSDDHVYLFSGIYKLLCVNIIICI